MGVEGVPPDQRISSALFGRTARGEDVERFVLRGAGGALMSVLTYGARIQALLVPDREGSFGDVVLGYDDLDGYERDEAYHGAVIGRFANRIRHAAFTLDGTTYGLAANDGRNHLHGGIRGFDKVVWEASPLEHGDTVGLVLRYVSPDGEEGYPGELLVQVTYTLSATNALGIEYRASADAATPVNLTQHFYLNLAGEGSGDVLDHELTVDAECFTPLDAESVPTGEIVSVVGTPLDFRKPRRLGDGIDSEHEQTRNAGGYDANFVLRDDGSGPGWAARLVDPRTGRAVDVLTTEPGMQLYSGNLLGGHVGKGGRRYHGRHGVCLETQHFADSPNQPHFPPSILRPGQELLSRTIYAFGVVP